MGCRENNILLWYFSFLDVCVVVVQSVRRQEKREGISGGTIIHLQLLSSPGWIASVLPLLSIKIICMLSLYLSPAKAPIGQYCC